MTDERGLQGLLWEADRTAPRPAVRPVTLRAVQERLRRRRLGLAGLALAVLAAAPWFLSRTESRAPEPAAAVEALRLEVRRLLDAVADLRRGERAPDTDRRLALERSAMASYAYGETLRRRGDPAAAEQLERVARIWPGTAGGRLAGQELEKRERNQR